LSANSIFQTVGGCRPDSNRCRHSFTTIMTSLRCLNTAQWALLPARCAKVATNPSYVSVATFHDSATLAVRTYRDANKSRGVSAIHRKYPKPPLSISKVPLPEPVLDSKTKSAVQVDQDHGLYGFFMTGKKVLPTPEEDHKHGTQ